MATWQSGYNRLEVNTQVLNRGAGHDLEWDFTEAEDNAAAVVVGSLRLSRS